MLSTYIEKLTNKQNLTDNDIAHAITLLLDEKTSIPSKATFLTSLHNKPETIEELIAIRQLLQNQMLQVPIDHAVVDIVGTGGDNVGTVNISTGAAILAASCGVRIVKHGNRAVSSQCGSADVLTELGININHSPQQVAFLAQKLNFGFCFAPNFHPALQQLRQLRRELGIPTVFNLLGPLLNPANARHYVLGVNSEKLLQKFADILCQLNIGKSVIVHGQGIDEISTFGKTQVVEIDAGNIQQYVLDPTDFGMEHCDLTDLKGGDAKVNAGLLIDAFAGKPSAIANSLILTAAMAMYVYGMYPEFAEAVEQAKQKLLSGAALQLLARLREENNYV